MKARTKYYKMRQGRIVSGVLMGLSDKFQIDPTVARLMFMIFFMVSQGTALILYIVMANILPFKEDLIDYDDFDSKRGRRRKQADVIEEEDDWMW